MAQQQMKSFRGTDRRASVDPVNLPDRIPEIMQTIAASLRNQYSLGYAPTSQDGKYHKIKVELVAPDGGPMTVTNQKGKKVKF